MPDPDTTTDTVPETLKVWGGHDLTQAEIDHLYGPESNLALAEKPDGSPLYAPESVAAIHGAFTDRLTEAAFQPPKETAHAAALKKAGAFILGSGPVEADPCPDCGQSDTAAKQGAGAQAPPGPQFVNLPSLNAAPNAAPAPPESAVAPPAPAITPPVAPAITPAPEVSNP